MFRGRLPAVFTVAVVLGVLGAGAQAAQAQSDERPNVLIIVTDDQRAANTMWVMPKTRRYFQRQGVRYPNGFAVTPLCCPSRSTILTGRYAHNTGVRGNGSVQRLDVTTLFPRLLQEAGYRTAMVGKFLNSWPFETAPPYFHRWASGGGSSYVDPRFNVNGDVRTVKGYTTTLAGMFASRFLRGFEAHDSSPWLLYVAPHAPHHPWEPAPRYATAPVGVWPGNPAVFESDRSDKPAYVRSVSYSIEGGRIVRQGQLRTLMSVDDMVGRIFKTLRDLGERRRTLAIFTSDNGYLWTEHGLGHDKGNPGQKRVPYTPSIQIPFFLRWPGHVEAGTWDDRITGTVDIAPTVLEAAGIAPDPTKAPLDGRSILSAEPRTRIVLEYWRETWIPTWASIRTKRYQYVEYYKDDGTRFFREYYNLARDPWQLRNLLRDANPAGPDVSALAAQLRHDRVCVGTTGPTACP
jgi:arylsulfatase A-like enzyme